MSQERTAGQFVGEAWTKIQVLRDEIDRLNAVIKEQSEYIDAINKASDGLDTAVYLHMCHIERLEATIIGQAEAIREQTAKVQERDERLEKAAEWMRKEGHQYISESEQLKRRVEERDKEIELLKEKEGRLIHEARGASEAALKEAEENATLREEIERLRAGLSEAQVNVQHIRRIADFGSYTEKYAMVALGAIDRALKGAE